MSALIASEPRNLIFCVYSTNHLDSLNACHVILNKGDSGYWTRRELKEFIVAIRVLAEHTRFKDGSENSLSFRLGEYADKIARIKLFRTNG